MTGDGGLVFLVLVLLGMFLLAGGYKIVLRVFGAIGWVILFVVSLPRLLVRFGHGLVMICQFIRLGVNLFPFWIRFQGIRVVATLRSAATGKTIAPLMFDREVSRMLHAGRPKFRSERTDAPLVHQLENIDERAIFHVVSVKKAAPLPVADSESAFFQSFGWDRKTGTRRP